MRHIDRAGNIFQHVIYKKKTILTSSLIYYITCLYFSVKFHQLNIQSDQFQRDAKKEKREKKKKGKQMQLQFIINRKVCKLIMFIGSVDNICYFPP